MKVIKNSQVFQPISVVLETTQEVSIMMDALYTAGRASVPMGSSQRRAGRGEYVPKTAGGRKCLTL